MKLHTVNVTSNTSLTCSVGSSQYLTDVLDQPRALTDLLAHARTIADVPRAVGLSGRSRVIVSGMGSSHYGGFGLWRWLVANQIPAWWVETSQLLDMADSLISPDSLLWLTSQSGESAETVELLHRVRGQQVHVVGVTNNPDSSLGRSADSRIDLHAGDEATVSTKSYVNTLAVNQLVMSGLGGTTGRVVESLGATIKILESYLTHVDEHVASIDHFALDRHLVFVGRGAAAASAQGAALVIKEAAKVPAEGMSAGAFRHGPIELAGPKLAVAFFDHGENPHQDQNVRLANDLAAAQTEIGWVSQNRPSPGQRLPSPAGAGLDLGIRDALAFQTLSFALAQRAGVTAGDFTFASKVTDVL